MTAADEVFRHVLAVSGQAGFLPIHPSTRFLATNTAFSNLIRVPLPIVLYLITPPPHFMRVHVRKCSARVESCSMSAEAPLAISYLE